MRNIGYSDGPTPQKCTELNFAYILVFGQFFFFWETEHSIFNVFKIYDLAQTYMKMCIGHPSDHYGHVCSER